MTKRRGTQGYLSIILHAHLPYVRHPEHPEFLEERWFFEAITESYLPLLSVLNGLVRDAVDFRLTVGVTPTLISMLQDELLLGRYEDHLDRLVDFAAREERRLANHAAHGATARFYRRRLDALRENYRRLDGDLIGAFGRLHEAGLVELIASAATHAYLPNFRAFPSTLRAQVRVGVECFRRAFGRAPAGFWLPECAYCDGLDRHLAEFGLRFFVLETHGLRQGRPRPRGGANFPVVTPAGLAVFGRDAETSRLVWSSQTGYPGDPDYRDFYKDAGYDLPRDVLGGLAGPDGHRVPSGLKFHRITGQTAQKAPYVRERALERVEEHAEHFVSRLAQRLGAAEDFGRRPLCVSPYDAELFGHWWFEGPEWLDRVLRRLATGEQAIRTTTPSEYLAANPEAPLCAPAESSWGEGGFHEIWLNPTNDAWLVRLQEACRRFERLADRDAEFSPDERCALDQAARELLLAQASDWSFLRRVGTSVEYAERRIDDHLERFETLCRIVDDGHLHGDGTAERASQLAILEDIRSKDPLFPWPVFDPCFRECVGAAAGAVEWSSASRRVVFLTAEAFPYAKAGGLADVCGALPAALARQGVDVRVILPAYRSIDRERFGARVLLEGVKAWFDGGEVSFDLLELDAPARGVRVYLVDHPELFDREGVYVEAVSGNEYPDTAPSFLFFCRAALEALRALGEKVDVLHAHDHQTAMALALKRLEYRKDPVLGDAAGIFTLHNLGYQGCYGPEILDRVGIGREWFYPGSPFEFFGDVNLMKLGIVLADKVNAVSENYAREICEDAALGGGLEADLRERGPDLVGIVNGIDTDEWNPAVDPRIPCVYHSGELDGKRRCKAALMDRMALRAQLRARVPIVGMVTRLVDQKGLDLVEEGLDDIMALGVHLVILGTGLPKYHEFFEAASRRFEGRLGVQLRFDNDLAHGIEAGADIFLMPSLYEPCGLNQLYSLRYGTVPVVRSTGGLADTVQDDDEDPGRGVGFCFAAYTARAMVAALRRAVRAFEDEKRWQGIVERGMARDHSWDASAARYVELYEQALARRASSGHLGSRKDSAHVPVLRRGKNRERERTESQS